MGSLTRRRVLQSSFAAMLAASDPCQTAGAVLFPKSAREKLPVAGVVTVYHRNSHADVILGKILEGFQQDGGAGPDLKLVSLYVDQLSDGDLSRDLAHQHGFRLARTIEEAITLGTSAVQVRGVLSIGEHGNYPRTPETGQVMYPRRRFFDEIVTAFRRCGQTVPVFNDKHLSWQFEDGVQMVRTAREMNFPLLAGSSLPVAWRYPPIELPRECEIESALSIGYGPFEAYGFHALEAHQCLLERRRGGESGVEAVQSVTGDHIRESEKRGEWSTVLLDAALQSLPGKTRHAAQWIPGNDSAVFLIRHLDGLKSAVVMANGLVDQFAVAVLLKGESKPVVTWFKLQEAAPYAHFAYLLHAFEETVHSGKAVYPVERTLLTTGILDRAMQSLSKGGACLQTPELQISWKAVDWPYANHLQSFRQLPND